MNKKDVESIDPLSPQQKGMLFETMFAGESAVHIEQLTWTWNGDLDLAAFQRAWEQVAARHSILRSAFVWKSEDPLQIVVRRVRVPVRFEDWRHLERHEVPEKLKQLLRADSAEKFDLTRPPLMRFAVLQTAETTFEVVSTRHHILMDGWCLPILHREFFQLYNAIRKGEDLELPPSRPYREYLAWLKQQDLLRAEKFWQSTLQGFTRPTPLGREEVAEELPEQRGHGGLAVRMPEGVTERLRGHARQYRVTLNTVIQGAWAVLLSRYSGQEDVLFGATVSGRPPELDNVEAMVGLFITTLPLRIRISAGERWWPWLQELQARNLEIREHQYCSTGQVHEWSEVPGSLPLFESIVVFENYPVNASSTAALKEIDVSNIRPMGSRTKYALTLIAVEGSDLTFHVIYDAAKLDHAAAQRILDHLAALLGAISADGTQEITELLRPIRSSEIPLVRVRNRQRDSESGFVAPRNETENRLAGLWHDLLGVKQIGIHENFFDHGGHSLLAVRLFTKIEQVFGKKLPLVTLLQAPTIAKLAKVISEGKVEPWRALVPIQASGTKMPFFCIHAAGGTVLFYRDLARRLGPDQPVYGLQARGLDGDEPTHDRIEDMAAAYIKEIRGLQPEGPYLIGGSSYGGVIAYEIACQLHAAGQEVGLLALFDTYGPGYPKYPPGTTRFRLKLYRWIIRAELHARSLWIADSGKRWPYIVQKSRKALHMLNRYSNGYLQKMVKAVGQPLPEALKRAHFSIHEATRKYVMPKYSGKATLFRATKQIYGIIPDPSMGWDKVVTGELEIHVVPAIHASMVQEPWVGGLVEALKPCLEKAQRPANPRPVPVSPPEYAVSQTAQQN